ncbi:hypothetical protein [Chondrinema litorale]|uniref:hypothetical protein n=1 Tax=Chondrinema litorale TaxID=2994555 RepID=UPI0025431AC1|nr:hypothetical protein [Chondrinema litorale]UZR95960.1 hypothetical protein OQ292_09055 [Chondrinema litorale]
MEKVKPKGKPDKLIKIKLSEAERSRFKMFCKMIAMNYSEVFRAMSNELINSELKKRGIALKCPEPSLFPEDENQVLTIQKEITWQQ